MDLPKKQGNRREIGGFFEIHRIRWKTPKFGGVKNPEHEPVVNPKSQDNFDSDTIEYNEACEEVKI